MTASGPTLWPLKLAHFPIPIHAAPVREPDLCARMLAQWAILRARNPRFFDGPLLTLRSLDSARGIFSLQHDSYMPYAVQPQVDTSVTSLGVTAILSHQPADSTPHYFFGQRAPGTHMYPNQWELGPSGALSPPATSSLSISDVITQMGTELSEEVGLHLQLSDSNTQPLCCVLDPVARSLDLVFLIQFSHLPWLSANWEYQAHAWVSAQDFPSWSASRQVIAPSIAIMQHLTQQL